VTRPAYYIRPPSRPRIIGGVEHWYCPSCSSWVPRDEMGVRRARWNGLDVYCRSCKSGKERARREGRAFAPVVKRKASPRYTPVVREERWNRNHDAYHSPFVEVVRAPCSADRNLCGNKCRQKDIPKGYISVAWCADCSEPINAYEQSEFNGRCVCCATLEQVWGRMT
jgi:hypothetical protein